MTNAEKYIELYKELEALIRERYKLSKHDSIRSSLLQMTKDPYEKKRIEYCIDVRNFLSHNVKIGNDYPVQPTSVMIDFIARFISLLQQRPKCNQVAIPVSKVFSKNMDDYIHDAIMTMREKNYTGIPLLQDGVVTGVFSEKSLFDYVADEGIIEIHDKLSFRDLKKYVKIDASEEVFRFYKANAYVEELVEVFENEFKKRNRLAMVFLTNSGKPNEKLLGILTPWDVLGRLSMSFLM